MQNKAKVFSLERGDLMMAADGRSKQYTLFLYLASDENVEFSTFCLTIANYFKKVILLMVQTRDNIKKTFFLSGATSAPSLIFILPGIFYIRIVPEEQEPLKSRPKIQVNKPDLLRTT